MAERRHHRRTQPRGRARDAVRLRLFAEGPGGAGRRRREHLDRNRSVQLPPARAGRVGEGRHPRGGRHADGIQHGVDLRRHHDGLGRHAHLARQPRSDRRLDRARDARQPVRRARHPGRLRQDHPRGRDGARTARHPRADSLRRVHRPRTVPGPRRHDPGRVRGGRRACGRQDVRRGLVRDRGLGVPRGRRLRRPVHGEHHGDRL